MTVTSVCLLIVFRSVFAVNSMGDDALAPEKNYNAGYIVYNQILLVRPLTALCVSFNRKAPDPNLGCLQNRGKIS